MNKEEAKKILETNTTSYCCANDEVLKALNVFDDNGAISLEGWSYFYKSHNYTFHACISEPVNDGYGDICVIPVWTEGDDNEALAQALFCEAGCAAQMEYVFEMYEDSLTEQEVKKRIEDVCKKYGFNIEWEKAEDHPEFDGLLEDW